ncbi:MAG: gamma-glutamyltransferase [Pirellulales bacterium]
MSRGRVAAAVLAICVAVVPVRADELRQEPPASWHAEGGSGVVACGGPGREAVEAGLAVLEEGGNAIDAAAATLLVLCVIDSGNFCFGGECPILVYDAKRGVVEVIAGVGAAPRLATLEYFRAAGGIPRSGAAAAAVPGAFDGILTALERSGTITLARAARAMLAVLDARSDGWCRDLARTMRELIAAEATAADRRQGLRRAADHFYRGPIARRIDAWSRGSGCLIRAADLATHVTRVEDPLMAEYRGHTIVKCGPWSQGPMLLEAVRLLEGSDVKSSGADRAAAVHLMTESLKLALADRDAHYGDPLFADVPLVDLLAEPYTLARRRLIDVALASWELRPGRPVDSARPGDPPPASPSEGRRQRDTTTCVVADAHGNVVAATPSGWAGVVAGDTGIMLGSRLQSFALDADHPNRIEPGKRPRITLTPTLVLQAGRPVLAISVAGGDVQDQVTLQLLVDLLDDGMTPAEAVTRPRFQTNHHVGSFGQTPPQLGSLVLEKGFDQATVERLRALGHDVTLVAGPIGDPVVLRLDPPTGRKEAAGDPRSRRQAAAE